MLPAYLQVPWMEEVLTILFTAVVYILAHFSLKSAKLLHHEKEVKRGKKIIKDPTEAKVSRHHGNTGLDHIKAGALVRSPQPKTWKEVEGVTDSRFQGTIVCYKPEEGYGFIRCPELYKHFSRDVFLHRLQVGSFNVGATVSFGVFLNKEGLPQAKELEAALPVREVLSQPEPSRVPAPDFSKQRADLFAASGFRPHTQGLCQNDQLPTMPPRAGLQAWADVRPRVLSLSGLWAGDRASTYEVHFHLDPPKGQPSVGTVVRCRPNCAPKSLHLLWDETSGQLSLSDHFAFWLKRSWLVQAQAQTSTHFALPTPPLRNFFSMLRQAVRLAGRQAAVALTRPSASMLPQTQIRAFGAVTTHKSEEALARPFKGASRSEPDMEYVEEPSMLYMTCLLTTPFAFCYWFLTQYV